MSLGVRACFLGGHAALYPRCKQKSQLKRPIKFSNINVENIIGELSRVDIPQFVPDISTAVNHMTNVLYRCASASGCVPVTPPVYVTVNRWERFLMIWMTKR